MKRGIRVPAACVPRRFSTAEHTTPSLSDAVTRDDIKPKPRDDPREIPGYENTDTIWARKTQPRLAPPRVPRLDGKEICWLLGATVD